jgi:hypothetical protein
MNTTAARETVVCARCAEHIHQDRSWLIHGMRLCDKCMLGEPEELTAIWTPREYALIALCVVTFAGALLLRYL